MKYPKVKAGKWVQPKMDKYLMACCDCGLVHQMEFRVTKTGKVQFRAWREEGETKKLREREKINYIK